MIYFKKIINNKKLKRALVFILTFAVIYPMLMTSLVTKKYDLTEGEIAKLNIKAQREIKDEITTQARIKQEEDSVAPQYSRRPEVRDEAITRINTLFTEAMNLKDISSLDEKQKVEKIKNYSSIGLSDEDFGVLIKLSKEDLRALQQCLLDTLEQIFESGIEYNPAVNKDINDENIKKAQESALLKFNSSKLSKTLRDLGTTIANSQIKPNSFYDKEQTEELKREAIKKVPPTMIKKDQIIVKEGEPVTKYQIELLKAVGLLSSNSKSDWYIYISLAVLVILILFLESFYLQKCHEDVYNDLSKFVLINILSCISIILARTLTLVSPFLIPLACVPMLLTLLIDYNISMFISVINCVFISAAMGFNIEVTILAVVNAVIGAIILRKMQQRNDIIYACIYISVINFIFASTIGLLLSNNFIDVGRKAAFAFVGSSISAVLTIGFLPFFESTFNIVTVIKLLEISNPNSPLLKRLLMEAPGTYHHSLLVANLAEVAAELVGASPVVARVSAYYHDVGKLKRPFFFKENQINNDNPHNKITPNLSALIISSHVKDGVELAKEYKIPKVIIDTIEQHHGTSLVKYFYITAKNCCEKPEEINEEDFRYPGPIPKTKVAGIIMLADSIEASVRSISEPTSVKIETMVNNIIKDKLNDGQLDNCDLTLKDLDKIKKAFLNTLNGVYHQRIEYPVDKWENK